MQHRMAHAQRARLEPRNGPCRDKGIAGDLRFPKDFDVIAIGIVKGNQLADQTLIGQSGRFNAHGHACVFKAAGQTVQIVGVVHFPPHEIQPLLPVIGDQKALLAIVHPKGPRIAAAIHLLHAQKVGGKAAPILGLCGPDADISK